MSSHNDEVRGRELAMTWELDLDYLTIARFTDLVLERSLEHTAYTSWATERMTLEGVPVPSRRGGCPVSDFSPTPDVLALPHAKVSD